jgi:hypothetical protein
MTLATASWDRLLEDPLGPVWLALEERRRRTLLDLPDAYLKEGGCNLPADPGWFERGLR